MKYWYFKITSNTHGRRAWQNENIYRANVKEQKFRKTYFSINLTFFGIVRLICSQNLFKTSIHVLLLWEIFGPKRQDVAEGWTRMSNMKLHNIFNPSTSCRNEINYKSTLNKQINVF
jgi:hypothetical protein